jgi:protein phosphatase
MLNVLYRSVGHHASLEIDTYTHTLPAAARLLLCSDGLWNMVEAARILDIVNSESNPQEACDKLIALANHRGGKDNITAIVVNAG